MILQLIFSQLFSYPFCTRKSQLAIKAMAAQELKHLCLEPKQDNVEQWSNLVEIHLKITGAYIITITGA